jgi:hypothetical protein
MKGPSQTNDSAIKENYNSMGSPPNVPVAFLNIDPSQTLTDGKM